MRVDIHRPWLRGELFYDAEGREGELVRSRSTYLYDRC